MAGTDGVNLYPFPLIQANCHRANSSFSFHTPSTKILIPNSFARFAIAFKRYGFALPTPKVLTKI